MMTNFNYLIDITERLKLLFRARSTYHLFIIFLIFSISGGASLWASDHILNFLGLESFSSSAFIYWILKIPIIILSYQFILLAVSAVFGEFKHFSKYSLKTFFILKKLFQRGRL